ncbi:MAG: glycosyltransferase family 4 protein [Calditrichia bacterium]
MITFEFPPQQGGIGTYSFQIAKNLSLLGNKVIVLANTNSSDNIKIREFDEKQSFKIIRYKYAKSKLWKTLHRILFTIRIYKKEKFDLLFIPYPNAAVIGLLIKRIYGTPYVAVAHGGSEFLDNNYLLKQVIKYTYDRADIIFANSNYTKEIAQTNGIKNTQIITTFLGADDLIYDYKFLNENDLRKKYHLENKKVVLTVGSLKRRKGHMYVIKAIDKLVREIENLIYLIVGTGPEENELKNLVKEKGLEYNVRFEGYAGWEKLREYYSLCDLFILNSIADDTGAKEGFGIVFLEANLMKKPVIGTKNSGIEDAIKHGKNGLLITEANTEATYNALKLLLTNPNIAKRMGEYGYKRTKEEFTWKNIAKTTNQALIQILSES